MPEARCLCGDHVWSVDAPLQLLHHCHCAICRKHQGAAYTTMGGVPPEHFRWISRGECIVYESSPGFQRLSCARCGSPLPGDAGADMGLVMVFAAPLEGDPGSRPQAHIFAGSKAPWLEIEDDLPRFDAYPPGFDAPVCETPVSPDPAGDGVRGSCLCGAVAWLVEGKPEIARHCHCLRCRRARGALHSSNMKLPMDGVRFSRGEERVRTYEVPEARYYTQCFCAECGGPVPRLDPERRIAIVPLGSLDDDPGIRVDAHIFAGSRAPWHEIPGTLPQHDEGPPA